MSDENICLDTINKVSKSVTLNFTKRETLCFPAGFLQRFWRVGDYTKSRYIVSIKVITMNRHSQCCGQNSFIKRNCCGLSFGTMLTRCSPSSPFCCLIITTFEWFKQCRVNPCVSCEEVDGVGVKTCVSCANGIGMVREWAAGTSYLTCPVLQSAALVRVLVPGHY